MKKYAAIRLRSKSEGISFKNKVNERKYSFNLDREEPNKIQKLDVEKKIK